MNCQELTQLLDDGDIRHLPQAKRRELDIHLSGCADCAAEWRVQERIIMTPALSVPAGFVAQCRQLVAAGAARRVRRVVLYSSVLVLAAAAALLAWRMWTPPARPATVAAVPVVVAPVPAKAPPLHASPQIRPEPEPTPERARPQPMLPPAAPFTVAVRPLQIEGNDVEGNALAARFRDRVMALLQGVPNLVLVDMQSGTDTAAADFELRMKYGGLSSPISRALTLEIQKPAEFAATEAAIAAEVVMSPADQQRSKMMRGRADIEKRIASLRGGNAGLTLLLGQFPTLAIIDAKNTPQPDPLEFSAQQLVTDLRIKVFPLDQSFEQQQLATLSNAAQKYVARRKALGALLSYAERRGGFSHTSPAVVRAGGEFALTAQSDIALERPMIWDGLALTGSPELVPYLIRGLNEVPLTETRLQLIKILAGKYGEDPRAQAALAAAAKSNDQQTVRMAAARELGGSQWSDYVVATLRNSTLPDVQRLQPIADMAPGDMGALLTSPKTKFMLEDSQLRELGALIIRIAPDYTAKETTEKALFAAGAMDTPAALDMLIEILHAIHMEDVPPGLGRASMMDVRQTAGMLIIHRYAEDPKARSVLAELANSSEPVESMAAQLQLRIMDAKAGVGQSHQEPSPPQ